MFMFGFSSRAMAMAALMAAYAGVSAGPLLAQGGPPPAPPVTVASPLAQRVTLWDEYTGRFEAQEQVEVRARVSGFIDQIHFKDGQIVTRGDPLFTIDPRPYKLLAEAAKAEVERSKAQALLAENEVERAEALIQNRTVTIRDLDTRRATLSSARASQQAAEANLKTAELNLDFTLVRAPLTGRISDKRIDVGNLIAGGQAGATLLTTIVSQSPIHFQFEVPEADYLRFVRASASGQRVSARESSTPVQVKLADEASWSRTGMLNFVDNQLNARSATIRGRAVLDNKDGVLAPGIFGRIRLSGGEVDAVLVPDSAIVSDQTRKVVFVVGPENKVMPRPVTLGAIFNGLRVIRSGLTVEDKVIIVGLANPMVRPGIAVTPQPGEIKPVTN